MAYDNYALIRVVCEGRVVMATIDNPPINIVTMGLFGELARLAIELEADRDALVFVLKSADPDFFMAHFDVGAILDFPVEAPAARDAGPNAWHEMCERFATVDKVTIAQIEGRVGGGGAEISMAFDMRFGVLAKTIVNQMEVPLGIIPGGTGTQRLPRLVGHGRAMEIILAGTDMDAATAERWGWLNRAMAADEIGPFVAALAARIASFPADAVRLAKQSVSNAARPLAEGLAEEGYLFQTLIRTPAARAAMARFLASGGQTRDVEMRIAEVSAELGKA
nr:enoyl-CoA hydratase/isomerase family protein [Polymorphobacter sp.]